MRVFRHVPSRASAPALLAIAILATGFTAIKVASATTEAGPLLVTVTTSPNPYAIRGNTSVANSAGILGYGTGTKDVALEGYATQPGSVGLEGFAQSTSGTASNGVFGYSANGSGIYGVNATTTAPAIFGENSATGGFGITGAGAVGIYGITNGTSEAGYSTGVLGVDLLSSAGGEGVLGQSANGSGVAGDSDAGSGVFGATTAGTLASVAGVVGIDGSSNGTGIGVEGNSANGYAVFGTSANYYGVVGRTTYTGESSTNPFHGAAGVVGEDATSGSTASTLNAGVYGTSENAYGVIGETTGTGAGVEGYASAGGIGVNGYAKGDGTAVSAFAGTSNSVALQLLSPNGAPLIEALGNSLPAMSLDASGNMTLAGKLTQNGSPESVVRDTQGRGRLVYASQSTEATLDDLGESRTSGGRVFVPLQPDFASVLMQGASYLVFLTPQGPGTLYVASKSAQGFIVRSLSGGDIAFDYRIVARPHAATQQPRLAFSRDLEPSVHARTLAQSAPAFSNRARLIHEVTTTTRIAKPPHRAIVAPKIPAMPPVIRP